MGGEAVPAVLGIFAGRPATFGDGSRSAIVKYPVREALWLDRNGFGADEQADQIHHGGADRAICQYPADHLPYWRDRHPDQEASFVPGAFGENLSTRGLEENQVSVGDIFRLGEAAIQVTQPRQPCWKVNQRFGIDRLSRQMVDTRRSGWLCRVLEPGWVPTDAALARLEAGAPWLTLEALWAITTDPGADPQAMEAAAGHPALAEAWRLRLTSRAQWLRKGR